MLYTPHSTEGKNAASYLTYPTHALQRGNDRQDIFPESKDKEYFLKQLKKYAQENRAAIGAYCLMTNHFHLLIYPHWGSVFTFDITTQICSHSRKVIQGLNCFAVLVMTKRKMLATPLNFLQNALLIYELWHIIPIKTKTKITI